MTNTFSVVGRLTGVTSSLDDATHPATLATGLTYAPHGGIATLVNGAVSGGTQRQESYDYNNRLQPVRMQLGTASNASENYCLVYNYYVDYANPTSCAVPSPPQDGSKANNGSLDGDFFQDNTSTPTPNVGHTATVGYDKLNRLNTFSQRRPEREPDVLCRPLWERDLLQR